MEVSRFGDGRRPPAMGGGILSPESLPRRFGTSGGGGGYRSWRHSTTSWSAPWAGGGGVARDLEEIPSWDGAASKWCRYKMDVALWIEGINLGVSWSWAARMVRCLSGPAKTLGESILMGELRAKPWTRVPDARSAKASARRATTRSAAIGKSRIPWLASTG